MLSSRSTSPETTARNTARSVDAVYPAPQLHWVGDGFRVFGYFNAIPDASHRLSPFLLLDYHPAHNYPPSTEARGVGVHPHRGFETVTLAFQGSVAHHDSAGNGGVIGPGDVQWMTAASGILHKEYHEAVELPLPQSYNTALLIMAGELTLGEESVAREHDFVIFKHDGDRVRVRATTAAEFIVMSGEAIDEPVVKYGPFVMNTQQEIREAFIDFGQGKFGVL